MTLLELLDKIKEITGNENVRWGHRNGEIIIYTGFSSEKFNGAHMAPLTFDYGQD